jgi:hypothetical protein
MIEQVVDILLQRIHESIRYFVIQYRQNLERYNRRNNNETRTDTEVKKKTDLLNFKAEQRRKTFLTERRLISIVVVGTEPKYDSKLVFTPRVKKSQRR